MIIYIYTRVELVFYDYTYYVWKQIYLLLQNIIFLIVKCNSKTLNFDKKKKKDKMQTGFLDILLGILIGAVSTGNIGRIYKEKEKELGRAPSMANCLSTTVPVNLAASQIAGRHTPTRNSLRHSRMIVMHRTGHRE